MPESPPDEPSIPQGRLDPITLQTMGRRAASHPLVETWQFEPDSASPRMIEIRLDTGSYPIDVEEARLDVRWFVTDDYSLYYVETRNEEPYQCRWDRHPKTDAPRSHFHPPPDAGTAEESTPPANHLEVLFTVLGWIRERVHRLHTNGR